MCCQPTVSSRIQVLPAAYTHALRQIIAPLHVGAILQGCGLAQVARPAGTACCSLLAVARGTLIVNAYLHLDGQRKESCVQRPSKYLTAASHFHGVVVPRLSGNMEVMIHCQPVVSRMSLSVSMPRLSMQPAQDPPWCWPRERPWSTGAGSSALTTARC